MEWYFAPVWRPSLTITENSDPDVPTKHCASAVKCGHRDADING